MSFTIPRASAAFVGTIRSSASIGRSSRAWSRKRTPVIVILTRAGISQLRERFTYEDTVHRRKFFHRPLVCEQTCRTRPRRLGDLHTSQRGGIWRRRTRPASPPPTRQVSTHIFISLWQ